MAFSDQESPYSGGKFIGYLAAYGVSRAVGANLFIPAILSGISIWLIGKFRPLLSSYLRYSIGILLGQAAFMSVGAAMMPQYVILVLPDIFLAIVITAWIVLRPSRPALFVLIGFEVFGIVSNCYSVYLLSAWGPDMGALIVHITMRTAIIGFGIAALQDALVRFDPEDQMVEDVFA